MNKYIVKIEHLSHRYSKQWAIRDINFEIDEVGVMGLLGSNGAGKSTIMNILCGVLNQTEGRIFIDGIDMRESPEEAKKLLGFLPQSAPLYLDFTVREYLAFCADLRHIPAPETRAAVDEVMEKCGIAHFERRLIQNLSGGYRQRVGIAQAIIHKPKLVVLDEPTNGLDPNQILEVRKLIKEIGTERAVIFSTHMLSEVEATCDHIKMIEHGQVVFSDTMQAFNNYIQPNSMKVTMGAPPSEADILAIDGIIAVQFEDRYHARIEFVPGKSATIAQDFVELSVLKRWYLKEITMEKSSLENIFAQLSKHP